MMSRPLALSLLALGMFPCQPGKASDHTLAVIVHKSNPIDNLTLPQLRKILLGEVHQFPDHRKLVLAEREPDSDVHRWILLRVLRMTPVEYKRYLLGIEFRGAEALTVKILNSDDTAAKFVFNVPTAIAVIDAVPAGGAASRVKIVRIEGKLPGEPGYEL
jgi:hypothetical protein